MSFTSRRSILGKTVSEVLNTAQGHNQDRGHSFFSNMDQPRLMNNIVISSVFSFLTWNGLTFFTQHCISCIFPLHSTQCQYLYCIFFHCFSGACSPPHLKMAAQDNKLWIKIFNSSQFARKASCPWAQSSECQNAKYKWSCSLNFFSKPFQRYDFFCKAKKVFGTQNYCLLT